MKNLTKTILTVIAAGLVTTALSTHEAQAAHIFGTIGLGGAVTFDLPLQNATTVTQWRDSLGNLGNSTVQASSGDFDHAGRHTGEHASFMAI